MEFMMDNSLPLFSISLAQWSLHRTIFASELDPLDFPLVAKEDFSLCGVEYVNTFYKDHRDDAAYWLDLKRRSSDLGVTNLLIMIDHEGDLGDPRKAKQTAAVNQHMHWAEIAAGLGCHSIRVNARSEGTPEEQAVLVAEGLHQLCEAVEPLNLNVLVENHGGLSSNGKWLTSVIKTVDHPLCGTLPDFGNFLLDRNADTWYDRYVGVTEMIPFAKAVSAKSNDFDADGNEIHTDFRRMMQIVLDAGYRGWVGVEYEGESLAEPEGIRHTIALLKRVRDELTLANAEQMTVSPT